MRAASLQGGLPRVGSVSGETLPPLGPGAALKRGAGPKIRPCSGSARTGAGRGSARFT